MQANWVFVKYSIYAKIMTQKLKHEKRAWDSVQLFDATRNFSTIPGLQYYSEPAELCGQ